MSFAQFILVALIGTVTLLGLYRQGKLAVIFLRLLVVALPLFVLDYIAIRLLFDRVDLPAPLEQATVAAVVLATGWFVTYLSTEDRASRERSQLQTDVLLALRSEIFTIVEKLDKQRIRKSARDVQKAIRDGGDSGDGIYVPFATSESPATVFQAVASSTAVLEAGTLEPILRFYAAYSDLTSMVQDVRSDAYRLLDAERRVTVHRELVSHRIATLQWGLRAIAAINEDLDVKEPQDIPRSGQNKEITL